MPPRPKVFTSSIGTKVLISLTGLCLILFLILHLAGNLLIFLGPATFNGYSHKLVSNPLLGPLEILLLAVFLLHLYKAIRMWLANRGARPVPYARKTWAGHTSRKSLSSSTMILSGAVILLFVVLHLRMFKYGPEYSVPGTNIRDLYTLEMQIFSNPLTVGFYVLCMLLIGSHLWHGSSSAFQSLGVDQPRYARYIRSAGRAFALIIAAGFIVIPIWVYLVGGRS
ncbi:MAG TPA: succinate dehydrogenase cytochrome b subunit [Vicinamibacterales bacterium]|nr:succinate dehydrogenase cytochrome b subunit [Vicinamibacterales bacterium]